MSLRRCLLTLGAISVQVAVVPATQTHLRSVEELVPRSPCGPTAEQLEKLKLQGSPLKETLLGDRTAGAWTGPKFYLYEFGPFNFTKTVNCYFRHLGMTMHDANMDELVTVNNAEHTTDVWVLESLRRHPGRVWDSAFADLHIVGAAIGTSFHASQLEGSPCGTLQDHGYRMQLVADEIENMWAFKKKGGRPWMLIDTDWNWGRDAFIPRLTKLVAEEHMLLGTVDRDISALGGVQPSDTIVLPYKTLHTLDAAATGDHVGPEPLARNFSFTFHGDMHRKHEGQWRWVLQQCTEGLDATSVKDTPFTFDKAPRPWMTNRTSSIMAQSAFCLVPAGDTASSRRLFDALAAGCVPIIFNDFHNATVNLPFTNSIDWSQIVYFAGDLQCLANNTDLAKDWLRDLWNSRDSADVIARQERGLRIYRNILTYRSGDLVSAMLAEAGLARPHRVALAA